MIPTGERSPALNTTDTCTGIFDKGELNRDIFHASYGWVIAGHELGRWRALCEVRW